MTRCRGTSSGQGHELPALRAQCRKSVQPGEVDIDRLVESQRYEVALSANGCNSSASAKPCRARSAPPPGAGRGQPRRRVLENLRDKQAGQHRYQEERREMKRLDEVAQQQALREAAP